MPEKEPLPDIFLSYAWKDSPAADGIDNDFQSVGITLQRDVRDVGYRGNIKEFMHRIGASGFVVMLISDYYLRSANCIYEVIELLHTHQLEKRLLPVLLPSAGSIFDAKKREEYYDFWKGDLEIFDTRFKTHPNADTLEELKKRQDICRHLPDFFAVLKDIKIHTLEALKAANYKPMLDIIGVEDGSILEKVLAISRIKDLEEQELTLEELLKKAPTNYYVLFQRVWIQLLNNHFKKARRYFQDLLDLNPSDADSRYNIAKLFTEYFGQHEAAVEYYLDALRIDPDFAMAHNNLANVFHRKLGRPDEALKHYQEALRSNPELAEAHYNLAILLTHPFNKLNEARRHYRRALNINPEFAEAHMNLSLLLLEIFNDLPAARTHYHEAVRVNPALRKLNVEARLGLP